eukprot:scaffold34_cov124-Isochrysis_galbana.AAC.5
MAKREPTHMTHMCTSSQACMPTATRKSTSDAARHASPAARKSARAGGVQARPPPLGLVPGRDMYDSAPNPAFNHTT